jgi:hypothetical protein
MNEASSNFYEVNTDTDHPWVEICNKRLPHVNKVGWPVARVEDVELALRIADYLNAYPDETRSPESIAFHLGQWMAQLHKATDGRFRSDLYQQLMCYIPLAELQRFYKEHLMPMSFATLQSLRDAAEAHGFRDARTDETIDDYRKALAYHVYPRDRIEAYEILFGVGWDQWTPEQQRQSLEPLV